MRRLAIPDISPQLSAVLVLVAMWVACKALFIAPRFSDGNIYLYLGYLVRQGAVPYQDFFYSSPPLLPYISALWGSVFGFTWQSFGWLPLVATAGEAVLLYNLGKQLFSRWAAVTSVAMYLGSFAILASTDFASDVHMVALLCLASAYMAITKKPGWAGLLIALACLTKLYAGVIVIALVMWYLWQKRWQAAACFTVIFLVVFGGVNLLFWVWIGPSYVQAVVLNNLQRGVGILKWPLWLFFLQHDVMLLLGLVPTLYFWRRLPAVLVIPTLVLGAFLLLYPDIYYLYFKLLAICFALWWGWSAWHISQLWPQRWVSVVMVVGIAGAISVASWLYLTQQSRTAVITDLHKMVQYVQTTVPAGQPVYGDFSVTPLVARLADRPIVNNLVDTNVKFFNQKIFSYEQRAQELEQANVALLITTGYVKYMPPAMSLTGGAVAEEILQLCRISRVFPIEQDYASNAVIMWQCQS